MANNPTFDPTNVNLTTANHRDVICFLNSGENEYDGHLGARISALFVILVTSCLTTFSPVVASRVKRFRIPLYCYLFARYFGAGVIITTAFIHLLDPAYDEIGPASCVGMAGGWAEYPWPPCLALVMVILTFLLDFVAEWLVDKRYRMPHSERDNVERTVTTPGTDNAGGVSHKTLHSADQDKRGLSVVVGAAAGVCASATIEVVGGRAGRDSSDGTLDVEKAVNTSAASERQFRQQIAAFLVLEFGVIFHSVIIGLNLGVVGGEFSTLYPVVVFHQSFEGLGIGARLSAIRFHPRPAN